MTREERWKRVKKCRTEIEKCINLADKSKGGYEYWKQKKGVKSIINQKIFLTVNKLACKLAISWIKEQVHNLEEIANELLNT